jgi:hypothetical protein
MTTVRRSVLLTLCFVIAGCASGPAYKDVKASFTAVPAGSGRIFFYRASSLGAAIQPAVNLNGEKVGSAVPDGFFFVDRPPGDYEVTTATELKKTLTFHLDADQIRYVRLGISMGLFVGHVYPELIDTGIATAEIEKTKSVKK